jgi:hypothetical protein
MLLAFCLMAAMTQMHVTSTLPQLAMMAHALIQAALITPPATSIQMRVAMMDFVPIRWIVPVIVVEIISKIFVEIATTLIYR